MAEQGLELCGICGFPVEREYAQVVLTRGETRFKALRVCALCFQDATLEAVERNTTWSRDMSNEATEIENLVETCGACPTQYEGTIDGYWFYFRYRWGHLGMELWERRDFKGRLLFEQRERLGDDFDGVMAHADALRYMREFVVAYRAQGQAV